MRHRASLTCGLFAILAAPLLAGPYDEAVQADKPVAYWRFEESAGAKTVADAGTAKKTGTLGADGPTLGVAGAVGRAAEWTGPEAGQDSGKHIQFDELPWLTNLRGAPEVKSTTVEYWIKTSQVGTAAAQTWNSPAIFAKESPGDGDFYWGWIDSQGRFGMSTSDLTEIYVNGITNDRWHHVVLVKVWPAEGPAPSRVYVDGGAGMGGITITSTTAPGEPSLQDDDGTITKMGVTEVGGSQNNQYIGLLDEVAIYNKALTEADAARHYAAALTTDSDNDTLPDLWELQKFGNLAATGTQDTDSDGLSNKGEFDRKTNPSAADTDGDGASDAVETGTGKFVSATDRGSNPLVADSDGDGLHDGVETGSKTFVNDTNTGTDPNNKDSDGDGVVDGFEVSSGSNPNDATSKPRDAGDRYQKVILADKPVAYWRFEEDPGTKTAKNSGSAKADGQVGPDGPAFGKVSNGPALGKAIEFTGPASSASTGKYIDFGEGNLPWLTNLRDTPEEKSTTVEYWIKTSQVGTSADQTWNSPAIFGKESPGDGDFYWGWIDASGRFAMSTSDLREIYLNGVTDNKWHHVMLVKQWSDNNPNKSAVYIDGGASNGGQTATAETPPGGPSQQDGDGQIGKLGFVEVGGGGNVQFIGMLDEVAIYNKALGEEDAKRHYIAGVGSPYEKVVTADDPVAYWRFDEEATAKTVVDQGKTNVTGTIGAEGPKLGAPSVNLNLGTALEFTGPAAGPTTGKTIEFGAGKLPWLTNYRTGPTAKSTTVEYWFKTSQTGSDGENTWTNPSILATESPGDGDMYWGNINAAGNFVFSTSDIREIKAPGLNDNQWHHVVMVKEWKDGAANTSTMHVDGGAAAGGKTYTATTAAGAASLQDPDGDITTLGLTKNGSGNVQYIGFLDELSIYPKALTAEDAARHYRAAVGTGDSDGDGLGDLWEQKFFSSLSQNGAGDPDQDGLSNEKEQAAKTDPTKPDTDGDGLKDGVETKTGKFVSATDTGTDPLDPDADDDSLFDGAETNTGKFVSKTDAGSDPFKFDTDGDGFADALEVATDGNPVDANVKPTVFAGPYASEVGKDGPVAYWRFEEGPADKVAVDYGAAQKPGKFGPDGPTRGVASYHANLGKALEFTGPEGNNGTGKYVEFGDLPWLTNFRPATVNKTTTVEYWIQTSQTGANAAETWNSPALFATESPGDGDFYWGWIDADGNFGVSTSDIKEINAGGVTDGKWHHIIMVKKWDRDGPSNTTLYVDGGQGASATGQTIEAETGGGDASYQDPDGGITHLGFVKAGGSGNVQFIGKIDEVAIYTKALTAADAARHFKSSTAAVTPPAGGARPSIVKVEFTGANGANIVFTVKPANTGATHVLETSEDLRTWAPVNVTGVASGGNITFTTPRGAARAFYRAKQQ